jgi:hypothetical protein
MRPIRRTAAAALMLGLLAATPACAGDHRAHGHRWGGPDWQRHGWTQAPAWRHAAPPPYAYRPWRPAPAWHGWRDDRPHHWRHDGPRHAWRHPQHGWGPRDRW